jgi:hypothetical protein
LEGPAGRDYTIQGSASLGSWNRVTEITNTQATQILLFGPAVDSPRLFYRKRTGNRLAIFERRDRLRACVRVVPRDPSGRTDNTSPTMDLFEARRANPDKPFGEAMPLPESTNRFSACLPHLSADGRVLLFGSTRPDGKEREDIGVAERASPEDPFGEPVNFDHFFAGSQVNSANEEVGPSLSSDGLAISFSDYAAAARRTGRAGHIGVHARPPERPLWPADQSQ